MTIIERLFPPSANNNYPGSPIAKWALIALTTLFTGRSLIHYFKEDGGANSIASIISFPGTPNPDTVIYLLFSLWGGQQLIAAFVMAVVLFRYRALIPLMFLLIVFEQLSRIGAGLLHPLTADYYQHTPPGALMNLPLLLLAMVMLFLSLLNR